MGVERCICHEVSLEDVVRRAKTGQSFAQISSETGCCTGCGMCEAYVHVAMATGQSQLAVMSAGQVERVLAVARANGLCAAREKTKK
jgi:bacterioferritin-associated ferredoxin